MKLVHLACLFLFLAPSALAQTTPVLIPVFYNGPGEFGSQWFTRVRINNFTSQTIEGRGLEVIVECTIPERCWDKEFLPNDVGEITGPQLPTGFLLYIPSAENAQFEIEARFGEVEHNRYGVELPIVRENDFRRAPVVLPYVPLLGRQHEIRTTLRIYSPDAIPYQQVRVEIDYWGEMPGRLSSRSKVVMLSAPPASSHPLHPAFAMLDLQREFSDFYSGVVSVRVFPLMMDGGVVPRIWAMATAVDNDTNEVAVFSPR